MTTDTGNVPFAFAFDSAGQLAVAEAGDSSVHTLALGAGGTLTSLAALGDGEKGLCWIASAGSYEYVANAGSNTLSGYSVTSAGQLSSVGTTGLVASTDAGPIAYMGPSL